MTRVSWYAVHDLIRIYLLTDLSWRSGAEDATKVIRPAVATIKLSLDVAGIYPSHRMKVVPEYTLKAVIAYYGWHYVSYVRAKYEWTRYDDQGCLRGGPGHGTIRPSRSIR